MNEPEPSMWQVFVIAFAMLAVFYVIASAPDHACEERGGRATLDPHGVVSCSFPEEEP